MATAQGERRVTLAGAKALTPAAEPTITRAAYLALLTVARCVSPVQCKRIASRRVRGNEGAHLDEHAGTCGAGYTRDGRGGIC